MFWAYFIYDFKGPCYIYDPKTNEQKAKNKEKTEHFNKEKIIEEAWATFKEQEREKERKRPKTEQSR
jgi:hypothetical protein